MLKTHASTAFVLFFALTVACSGSDPDATVGNGGTAGSAGASGSGAGGSGGSANGGSVAIAGAGAGGSAGNTVGGAGGASGGSSGSAGSSGGGSGGSSGADSGQPSTRLSPKPKGGANLPPNGYFEYLPRGYSSVTPTPLLVFWHGVGENGNGTTDLHKVLVNGPPNLISTNRWDAARPFIVLSPQHTSTQADGGGCPTSAEVDAFISWSLAHYDVDPKRVYLSGLSCGAIGSFAYLAEHRASVVAAAVLLSGDPGIPTNAGSAWQRAGCALGELALWSFHGDKDPTVPFAPDHDTMTNLIACPAPPRRPAVFTDIVNGLHDIWGPIYDLSGGHGDIYQWLLDNKKP